MADFSETDYAILDRPEVLQFLFHPRPEQSPSPFQNDNSPDMVATDRDILIPVDGQVVVGARFHLAERSGANLLFFHGNGEIVADYDELGPIYNQMGINFLAVDYRGYGRSTGQPTVTAMMQDCHVIFEFVQSWLNQNKFSGPVILMGRSLGSASVLELAAAYADSTDGLIVESGFAYAAPLLQLLGINPQAIGFKEEKGFRNIDKIKTFEKPTLIIHAEYDHIIPFSEGMALYEASPAPAKTFLKIPGANHNDIFMRGFQEYLTAVKNMVEKVTASAK